MKYLVMKPFIDKDTNKGYNQGNTYESDDLERVAFLQKEGYLKQTEKPKRPPRKPKAGE